MADLESRFRSLKEAPAPDLWREIEIAASQREPAARLPDARMLMAPLAVLAAVLVLVAAVPLVRQLAGTFEGAPTTPAATQPASPASVEPEPSGCVEPASATVQPASPSVAPSSSALPDLGLPGTRPARAGEYGWSGVPNQSAGMHRYIENQCSPGTSRETQLVFAVRSDCFPGSLTATGGEPEAVTVAGLEGLYLEGQTTNRSLLFTSPTGGETTGAYALPIGDLTLCVYLTWDPAITQDELEELHQVVESIRGQQYGPDRIRIIFTLPAGWDTG